MFIIMLIMSRKKPIIYFMKIELFFIWTNLNPLHQSMHCAKFGLNWPSGSEDNRFSLFLNYLSLEKGRALHLNKLEFPSPKDALCQVWLKLTQWFWRRRWKCEKFTTMPTTTTDNGQILIRKAHLSLQLMWAKKE